MRKPLHKEDFEAYLQQQVGNHRMFPSDQIWRNIQKEIHGEGRWPALTYISIFIITALVITTLMVKPEERLQKNITVYPTRIEENTFDATKQKQNNAVEAAPLQYAYTDKITQQTLQSVSDIIIARREEQNSRQPLSIGKESLLTVQSKVSNDVVIAPEPVNAKVALKQAALSQAALSQAASAVSIEEQKSDNETTLFAAIKPASRYFSTIGLMNPGDLKKPSGDETSFNTDDIWRKYPLLSTEDLIRQKLTKLSFQFYVTPSISYRRLNDAKGNSVEPYTALPASSNYRVDLNRVVENRPELGAEVGFALGYQITPSLTLKGGFQFNVRQYGIKAYTIPGADQSSLTSTQNTTGNALPDEHAAASYLASADNSSSNSQVVVLNNRYYEIAAPIGLDWRILSSDNGRLTFNTAIALQPTYTFDKQPFVLTTNYKSYENGASIMRNWNLNSNVEAYISYKIGPFRWQIGPQFRYQHLSTYSGAYPIREHLLDYGIKLGFTKSLN